METNERKPKVIFAYVNAGLGHISPMSAIAEAFEKKFKDKCEIVNSYVFKETKRESVKKLGRIHEGYSKRLGENKFLRAFETFSYALPSKLVLFSLDCVFGKGRRDLIKDFKDMQADLVVSTYYFPTHIARQANEKGYTNSLVATYIPDPYVYPAWDRKCDRLFVNNDKAYRLAVNKGFDEKIVKKVPPVFRKSISEGRMEKQLARKNLGIKEDAYVILYSAGAYGTKKSKILIEKIARSNIEGQLIVVCGTSEKMYQDVMAIKQAVSGKVELTVLKYVSNMNEYMCASDVTIGKAGSNTVMEASFNNLPLIISSEWSKLEEETAKYAVEQKTAIREKNAEKILEILEQDAKNKILKQKLTGMGKEQENGAEQVADELYRMLQEKFPNLK